MILVDTSVWVEHFRHPLKQIGQLTAAVQLVQHPFVTGELALGDLKGREAALRFLSKDLSQARVASEAEFLSFVTGAGLARTGIGFVDAHLLASCRLAPGTRLWSRDKRLAEYAERLGVAWTGN